MSSPFLIGILNGTLFFRSAKAMNNWKRRDFKQLILTNPIARMNGTCFFPETRALLMPKKKTVIILLSTGIVLEWPEGLFQLLLTSTIVIHASVSAAVQVTHWVMRCIIDCENFEERVAAMTRVVEIMIMFYDLNNFSGLFEMSSALESASVHRLELTKAVSGHTGQVVMCVVSSLSRSVVRCQTLTVCKCRYILQCIYQKFPKSATGPSTYLPVNLVMIIYLL